MGGPEGWAGEGFPARDDHIIVDNCPAHKMPDENAHFQDKTYYSQDNKEQLRGFVYNWQGGQYDIIYLGRNFCYKLLLQN